MVKHSFETEANNRGDEEEKKSKKMGGYGTMAMKREIDSIGRNFK